MEKDAKKINNLENLLDNTAVEMLELKATIKKQKEELVLKTTINCEPDKQS